jgi:hypothetical protein
MKILFIPFLVIFLFGCKKEVHKVPDSEQDEQIDSEVFIQGFTEYSNNLIVSIGGWAGGCQGASQFHSHGIKFSEGIEYDGKYFYSIETNLTWFNDCDTLYYSDWQLLNKYYRYSFDENKSYVYTTVDDNAPELIFDFNCIAGDTIIINQDKLAKFHVTYVGEQLINGIDFPVVRGKIVSFSRYGSAAPNDNEISQGSPEIVITPFSPNPFWSGSSLNSVFDMPWSNDQFCVEVTGVSVYYLSMRCTNLLNNQLFYNYGFHAPY